MNSKPITNTDYLDSNKFDYLHKYEVINYLIDLYNYESYLEIGIDGGDNFNNIDCAYKIGVDPNKKYDKLTHHMTSDKFFENNTEKFDVILIDGLHISDQVIIDIENGLKFLNPMGTIIMHDCLPNSEQAQLRERLGDHWNGDVWKAFAYYRKRNDLYMFTIRTDQGLGIIKKGSQEPMYFQQDINYQYYVANTNKIMNTKSCFESLELLKTLKYNNM